VVRKYLVEGTAELFRRTPELEGVLLITASENPTNWYSLTRRPECPRCRRRPGAEVIGEVVVLIEKGIRSVKPAANVVARDWSWGIIEDDPQEQIIARIPRTVTLMVDFERGMPIERDGVVAKVDEYSLYTPGPSPRASAHIRQARERGMRVMAKAQVGTTWEVGLLPFVPVSYLVARKFAAICSAGVSGAMESWALGGYPSLNWQVAGRFYGAAPESVDSALREVALECCGKTAADAVVSAWKTFAGAFEQYPFSNSLVYSSVVQNGPAQPWWLRPSGKTARILNSYDNLRWTAPYGPERWRESSRAWRSSGAAVWISLRRRSSRFLPRCGPKRRATCESAARFGCIFAASSTWWHSTASVSRACRHQVCGADPLVRSRRPRRLPGSLQALRAAGPGEPARTRGSAQLEKFIIRSKQWRGCCGTKLRSRARFLKSAAPTPGSGSNPRCNTFTCRSMCGRKSRPPALCCINW
jgi:hypothetical protein